MSHQIVQNSEAIFTLDTPGARSVCVAGCFNAWNTTSHPMKRAQDGTWSLTLDLPIGAYEYKFIVDGQWCCDVGCNKPYDGCPGCKPNSFGSMNRVLLVTPE